MSRERTRHLAEGCTRPDDEQLEAFYEEARQARPDADLPEDFQVRWIGSNEETTSAILGHIRSGDKTGTVSLPTVNARTGQRDVAPGDAIVLINFDGTPALVVKVSKVDVVPYGEITEAHTALDGPRVRALDVWKPLHVRYFDMLLEPHGLKTDDDTPIAFETFELVYSR